MIGVLALLAQIPDEGLYRFMGLEKDSNEDWVAGFKFASQIQALYEEFLAARQTAVAA